MSPNEQQQSPAQSNGDRCSFTYNDILILMAKCHPNCDTTDLRIVNFKLEPFSKDTLGFAGVYDLLTIDLHVRTTPRTLTFFVKSLSPFANDFQRMIFNEEFEFFDTVLPCLLNGYDDEPWSPRCFMARDNVLVLEDLRAQGYKVTSDLSDNQLRSAIVSIARFHASSMLLEEKLHQPLNEVYPGYFREKLFRRDDATNWQFMLAGVEVVETIARKLHLDPKCTLDAYEWLAKEIRPKARDTMNVLCHCDLWSNNVMFDEVDQCRLVDFQQAVYTSHIVDLVQFIHLNVDRETRRRLEMDLLGLYHAELCENLTRHRYEGETISLKELTRNYERKRIVGLVTAAQTLPLALLSLEASHEFTKDDEHFKKYMFASRRDFVLNVMLEDTRYRVRIEEVVEDLVGYMDKFVAVVER